jgi:hypothetical protein
VSNEMVGEHADGRIKGDNNRGIGEDFLASSESRLARIRRPVECALSLTTFELGNSTDGLHPLSIAQRARLKSAGSGKACGGLGKRLIRALFVSGGSVTNEFMGRKTSSASLSTQSRV